MFDYNKYFEEGTILFQKKLGKKCSEFTDRENAILADIAYDKAGGNVSMFLWWSKQEREEFLKRLDDSDINYSKLNDAESWAYEDAYDMIGEN